LAHLIYEKGRTYEDYLGLRGFRTTICGAFSAIQRAEAVRKGPAWKDRAAICLAIGAVVGVYGLVEGLLRFAGFPWLGFVLTDGSSRR